MKKEAEDGPFLVITRMFYSTDPFCTLSKPLRLIIIEDHNGYVLILSRRIEFPLERDHQQVLEWHGRETA